MDEEETQIVGGNGRPVQKAKVQSRGWTKQRRQTFLKVLAETCNVTLAVKTAGGVISSVYLLRRRDPAFASLWDEALAVGYDRLETMLLQRALEGVNDIDLDALLESEAEESVGNNAAGQERQADVGEDAKQAGRAAVPAQPSSPSRGGRLPGSGLAPGMARDDIQLALALLNRRRDGAGSPRGRKLMTSEEVDALLVRKLDTLARKLKGPA